MVLELAQGQLQFQNIKLLLEVMDRNGMEWIGTS